MGRFIWEISAWSPMIEFVNFVQLLQKLLDFHTDVKQRREIKIYIKIVTKYPRPYSVYVKMIFHYISYIWYSPH